MNESDEFVNQYRDFIYRICLFELSGSEIGLTAPAVKARLLGAFGPRQFPHLSVGHFHPKIHHIDKFFHREIVRRKLSGGPIATYEFIDDKLGDIGIVVVYRANTRLQNP